jgi:hypothetical protein
MLYVLVAVVHRLITAVEQTAVRSNTLCYTHERASGVNSIA